MNLQRTTRASVASMPDEQAGHRSMRWLPWLVLLISLVITFQLWSNEQQSATADLQADFDFRVRETNSRIDQRMKAYEQILRGVRSLFAADNNEVSRARFHDYIDALHLENNYPGAQAVGYLPMVAATQKDMFVATVRQEDDDRFSLFPPGERKQYAPTRYIEPRAGINLQYIGQDAYADTVRREAMDKSRDSGKVAISNKVLLPIDSNEDVRVQGGFVMYLPVYRNGLQHDTVDERRASIVGWIFASFRMVDMMSDILGDVASEVDIEIHDGNTLSNTSMMYDPDLSGAGGNPNAKFSSTRQIQVANHVWTVVIRSLYGFELRMNRQKSGIIAASGFGVSILLAFLVWLLLHGRTQALRAARLINRELIERKRAEEGLRLAATVVNTVEEAVMVTDPDNNIITVNPAFILITGYAQEEVIGKNPRILSSGRHAEDFFAELWRTLLATDSWHGEIWDKRKNGDIYIKWLSIRVVRDESGRLTHHVGVFSDITERKAAEEQMKYLAYFDPLTALPNRTLFRDRLQQSIARANREKGQFSLMFLDLDNFKQINDTLGHDFGDWVLRAVAQRLQDAVRATDTISRIGGDEFIVLLPEIVSETDAMCVAGKVLQALSPPFERAGHGMHISASIGIALFPQHGSDERTLIKNADAAMYSAKGSGRNNAKCFHLDAGGNHIG